MWWGGAGGFWDFMASGWKPDAVNLEFPAVLQVNLCGLENYFLGSEGVSSRQIDIFWLLVCWTWCYRLMFSVLQKCQVPRSAAGCPYGAPGWCGVSFRIRKVFSMLKMSENRYLVIGFHAYLHDSSVASEIFSISRCVLAIWVWSNDFSDQWIHCARCLKILRSCSLPRCGQFCYFAPVRPLFRAAGALHCWRNPWLLVLKLVHQFFILQNIFLFLLTTTYDN